MTKIHFYVDIWWVQPTTKSQSTPLQRHWTHSFMSVTFQSWVRALCSWHGHNLFLLPLTVTYFSPGPQHRPPIMLIRCGLNSVLVVNSVKIPNISRLSNWPLCHCEGIEDVLLTMTIINCNKFWFSTQWAFFTEQFELEANIPTPGWDGQMRILVIVLSPGVFELWWTLRQCQLSDFLSFYASNRDPRTLDIVTESVTRSLGCHAVCDRVSILTLQ